MSEFTNLSESKALDPYQDKDLKVVSKLKSPKQGMIDFFTYMAEEGWDKYVKEDFLRNLIAEYSVKTIENLYNEDTAETFTGSRNYKVLPKLQDKDAKRLMWKWQGNLMEIIAGNMFRQKVHPLTAKYELEKWTGDDKDDMGVDGWCRHVSNPKFKIGVQVKYRLEKDVKWNDQISKCMAITEQTVRRMQVGEGNSSKKHYRNHDEDFRHGRTSGRTGILRLDRFRRYAEVPRKEERQ